MQLGEHARHVLRLGCIALCVAALAGVWELLAEQAPGSRLSIGMLPGPIQLLREAATTFGVLLALAGLLVAERTLPVGLLWALRAGLGLLVVTGAYAGALGMHGLQAADMRPDAVWLFVLKYLGRALLVGGLAALALRVLRRG